MRVNDIYKYSGINGVVITPINLGIPCQQLKRLIAENGKVIQNGEIIATVIDVNPDEVGNWVEIDEPAEQDESINIQEA